MLVLTRRVNEDLYFPSLGICLKVLQTHGNRVRIGIDAPKSVEILRGENAATQPKPSTSAFSQHQMRNLLNAAQLGLDFYERQMSRGEVDAANQTFLRVVNQLRNADLQHNQVADSTACTPECLNRLPAGTHPTVLLVDDDANERELLAGLLQMDGWQVQTASDGQDAISYLQQGQLPEIVLLDMQMPRLCGKDTLSAIRNHWRELIVFGVSGTSPAENDITLGGPTGIDDWFEKPLNPSQLVHRVRERLKKSTTVSA